MRKSFVLLNIVLLSVSILSAQNDYYRSPLDIPLVLSSNFGELRTNHFHSGVDLKTQQREGLNVCAAADGYIARIGVVPSGFGRVLYVAHPNGTTTVYAHLSRFAPAIEQYVKSERYKQKRSNVDLTLDAKTFPVRKGDVIAYSGNSGRSYGAHLHYELRKTSDQALLNPISQGLVRVNDSIAPDIVALYWCPLDTVNGVAVHYPPRKYALTKTANGRYSVAESVDGFGKGYFAVETIDRKDGVSNKFVATTIRESVDGKSVFELSIDGFTFATSRYVNHLMSYALSTASNNDVVRLVRPRDVPLNNIYRCEQGAGLLDLRGGESVVVEVGDDNDNVSRLKFVVDTLAHLRPERAEQPQGTVVVENGIKSVHQCDGLRVTFQSGGLYEPIFYRQCKIDTPALVKSKRIVSPLYSVGISNVPVQKSFNIQIDAPLPDTLARHAMLGMVDLAGGKVWSAGGDWNGGKVSGNVTSFGTYCVVVDTVAPTVRASFANGADLSSASSVRFTYGDDFSGVQSFSATIDSRWIIFEQNVMNRTLTHYFDDERMSRGMVHQLVLSVVDCAGNKTVYRTSFRR